MSTNIVHQMVCLGCCGAHRVNVLPHHAGSHGPQTASEIARKDAFIVTVLMWLAPSFVGVFLLQLPDRDDPFQVQSPRHTNFYAITVGAPAVDGIVNNQLAKASGDFPLRLMLLCF